MANQTSRETRVVPPLRITTKLAGNPAGPPKWGVRATLSQGGEIELVDPRATRALVALMDMQAVLGGAASHWGGPAALADLMAAAWGLVLERARTAGRAWHELFHFINDAGHCENGLYALKANYGMAGLTVEALKGFRSITSPLTGHGESHLFPEGVYLSNGPLGSCFAPAQGLAMADRLAGVKRTTLLVASDGACMEGEAREVLASLPGFAAKGEVAPFVLIISDNNTKLSGRIDADAFSMAPTFKALAALGWNLIDLPSGNDVKACLRTLEQAMTLAEENPQRPVAVHARTIKGFGVKKTMESASGGHGFPLKDPSRLREFLQEIYSGASVPPEFLAWCQELEAKNLASSASVSAAKGPVTVKIQEGISQAMIHAAQAGLPVVSVTSDLPGSTGVAAFRKEFPDRSFDLGVAEANMVGVASGLSKQGYIPVVDTFAQFGVTKGALPLLMAALSEAPVIAAFSHTGFQDAADGASHQSLTYLSMTAALPGADVYALTSRAEAEALFGQAIDRFARMRQQGQTPPNTIFFLGRENFPSSYLPADYSYKLGKAQIIQNTAAEFMTSVTLVAAGSLIPQALEAASALAAEGIGSVVVNPSCLNRIDRATLQVALNDTGGRLVCLEDHQLVGGFASLLSQDLLAANIPVQILALGVQGHFGRSAYTAQDLYDQNELNAAAVVRAARRLVVKR